MVISNPTKMIACIAIFLFIFGVALYLFTRAPFKGPVAPEEFFALVDELANSGKLGKTSYVEHKLNVKFDKKHIEDLTKSCDAEDEPLKKTQLHAYKSRATDYYSPKNEFWFAPAFGVKQDLTMQKLMGNRTKPPVLDYAISKSLTCGGVHNDDPATEATLTFDNISDFLLIDEDAFKFLRPSALRGTANDTSDKIFTQPAKKADNYGAEISYALEQEMNGKYYLKSVMITQNEMFGIKALRIAETLEDCYKERRKETPNKRYDYDYCGTFDYMMDNQK
jgi:hypothetical protein